MENYQMFFPCPSGFTDMALETSSSVPHHDHVFLHGHVHHQYSLSNGFLGLKSEQLVNDMAAVQNENESENELKIMGKKKLGDQKKKKVKKPKYAFQTRSQVDILDDGYRWRKYGQKAVKHNKFPRSYYRCTHEGCNVKKQVQRLTRDEGVVITTYEGIHTHSIDKPTDNFEQILSRMQIYTPF